MTAHPATANVMHVAGATIPAQELRFVQQTDWLWVYVKTDGVWFFRRFEPTTPIDRIFGNLDHEYLRWDEWESRQNPEQIFPIGGQPFHVLGITYESEDGR
jgi:hypothetical protein